METKFGDILKRWRALRRLSQLELALQANVSARHISFIESGRSKPSRPMVGQLARTLGMTKSEANLAALAAGYAPIYNEHTSASNLAPLKRSIEVMLENHMPLPAIVLDRHWKVVNANASALSFLANIGFSDFTNIIEALTIQSPSESSIENWHEAVALVLYRLQIELAHLGDEPALMQLYRDLEVHFHSHGGKNIEVDFGQAVLPICFRVEDKLISIFSTVARFGTVFDLNLSDLQVELMFPSNEESEAYLIKLEAQTSIQ